MPQYFGSEKLTKLFRVDNTTVRLPLGSRLKISGQGLSLSSALDCVPTSVGVGGLDAGAIAASTFYYVYLVKDNANIGLVASTSASAPAGYTLFRKVGAFYTDGSSNIFKAYWFGEINRVTYGARMDAAGNVTNEGSEWIVGNAANVSAGRWTLTIDSAVFSSNPVVAGTIDSEVSLGWDIVCRVIILSSTQFRVYTTINGPSAGAANYPVQLVGTKQGIDAVQPDWSL